MKIAEKTQLPAVQRWGAVHRPAPTYRTRKWPAYNEALKRRGSLTIWFAPEMNWDAVPTGRRGRQLTYSDAAVQTRLTMKMLFGMALRQTTGFVESLLRLVGLHWTVPDFSTLSRRQKTLAVNLPYRGSRGPLHLLPPLSGHFCEMPCRAVDSTGIKVEGESEWHARKHGGPKRRAWRKIHLGSDEKTLGIRAVAITGSHVGDAPILQDLLDQIPEDQAIGCVTADGASDTRKRHDVIAGRGAHPVFPPGKKAKPWKTITAGAQAVASGARTDGASAGNSSNQWRTRARLATRSCAPPNTLAAPCGDDGAETTAGVALRRRCIV